MTRGGGGWEKGKNEWRKWNDKNEEVLLLAAVCFPFFFFLLFFFELESSNSPQIGIIWKSRVVSGATEPHRSPSCGAECHQRLSYCSPVTPPPPLQRPTNSITPSTQTCFNDLPSWRLTWAVGIVIGSDGFIIIWEVSLIYGLFDLIIGPFWVQVHGPGEVH